MDKPTQTPMSMQMADTMIKIHKESRWHYHHGLLMYAIHQVGELYGEKKYIDFNRKYIDEFVQEDGSIRTYSNDEYNLDQINPGKNLFQVWKIDRNEKYRKAIEVLRDQLHGHPRTASRGFWHKKIYPHQMWLDGLYMQGPFYAEYGKVFNDPETFDDLGHQIWLLETHARDPKTGLFYHAWNESKEQPWANKKTGCSPHFWGRAMGWFGVALVDILDFFPENHKDRAGIIAVLNRFCEAAAKVQDPSGMWWQILDLGGKEKNYLESSCSSMFVLAMAKGVRMGYLDEDRYLPLAKKGFQSLLDNQISRDDDGLPHLTGTCLVAGLGVYKPDMDYRDGSYDYYVSEEIVTDDYKGVGPFMLAALELERAGQGAARVTEKEA